MTDGRTYVEVELGPGQWLVAGTAVVTVNHARPGRVKLGVLAEPGVPVHRAERHGGKYAAEPAG